MTNWKTNHFFVLGLGLSGRAAVDLILRLGGEPSAYDHFEPAGDLAKTIESWREEGAHIHFGQPDTSLLDGVDTLVVSPGIAPSHVLFQEAAGRGIETISEIELAYRVCACPLIAVTGTNGKSTTTELIGEMFRKEGRKVAVAGNIGRPLSDAVGPFRDYDLIIVEVSSFQLETIVRFHPHVAILLNVTEDHLDRHGCMKEYIRLKTRVFENQTEDDYAVLNYDDPVCRTIGSEISSRPIWISQQGGGRFDGVTIRFGEIHSRIHGEELVGLERDITIPGPHNRMNALAAVAASRILDVPGSVIRSTLQDFHGLEHRLEKVRLFRGITFINDSKATNVESVYCALQSFDSPLVWIAGGRPKKPQFEKLRDLVAIHVRAMVLIGESKRLMEEVFSDFPERYYANSMEQAVLLAYRLARKGDSVLLSPGCTSFDMFADFEERGQVFKQFVSELEEREKHD